MEDIRKILAAFDPVDDSLWTTDGAPRLDIVIQRAGHNVTRAQIREAAPGFSRMTPDLSGPPKGEIDPATITDADLDNATLDVADLTPKDEGPMLGVAPNVTARFHSYIDPKLQGAERLAEVNRQLHEFQQARGDLDNIIGRLTAEQTQLQPFDSNSRGFDHKADQQARIDFIAAENKRAIEKAEHAAKVAAAMGGKLTVGSTLDRAMARKNLRGGARPAYPSQTAGA